MSKGRLFGGSGTRDAGGMIGRGADAGWLEFPDVPVAEVADTTPGGHSLLLSGTSSSPSTRG